MALLQPLRIDELKPGDKLPWTVYDVRGRVVFQQGDTVPDEKTLNRLVWRGMYVEAPRLDDAWRTLLAQADLLCRQDAPLGEIAQLKLPVQSTPRKPEELPRPQVTEAGPWELWSHLQYRLAALLSAPEFGETRLEEVRALARRIRQELERRPDVALLALVLMNTESPREYSSKHALLCAAIAWRLAHSLGLAEEVACLALTGALVMNVSMTRLQDELALQSGPVTAAQRESIDDHPFASAAILGAAGADEPLIELVRVHHHPDWATVGVQEAAGLLYVADIFAAKISPRATRRALLSQQAVRDIYLHENPGIRQYGAALAKSLGIHLPGCLVRLASGETAVVLRQGPRADWPSVAVIANREGLPVTPPMVRNTSQPAYQVRSALAADQVKVRVPPEVLFKLL